MNEPGGQAEESDDTRTVALLVLAHCAPAALEALAGVFAVPGFHVYVHLDLKVDRAQYSVGRRWPCNLTFIDDRVDVYWGGFSMIKATEALARAALSDEAHGAFALVSDDTLPLVPPSEIRRQLLARPDRIDVGISRRNPPFLRRYTEWFLMDCGATSARPVDIGLRNVDDTMLESIGRLVRLRARGKYPFPEVWGGSQWWSLGREDLAWALRELSSNVWLRESFEFSAVPDELAFQTIYANRRGLTARSFTSPMLTDMTRNPSPYVFRTADELPPTPEGKLFVRKVADEAAADVLQELQIRWQESAVG
jgi:hypothetical protein